MIEASPIVMAASSMFRVPSGRVVLVRRAAGEDHPGEWALPGGSLNAGEDAATAAVKETREEIGSNPGNKYKQTRKSPKCAWTLLRQAERAHID